MGENQTYPSWKAGRRLKYASGARPLKEARAKYLRLNIVAKGPDDRRLSSSSGSRNAGRDLGGIKLETDVKALADTLLPAGTGLEQGSTMAGSVVLLGASPFRGKATRRA